MKRLSYTSVKELPGEKFHMSEKLLQQLNPKVAFDQAGTEIVVANVARGALPRKLLVSISMESSNQSSPMIRTR